VQEGGCYEHYVGDKRSAAVRTIIKRPMGENRAPTERIRLGACSWYHGAVSVEGRAAQLRVC
jgi:hypothetical protein